MSRLDVCVVGLGYVGLPTAVLLAHGDARVYGVDINEAAVRSINEGKSHILEPGLDDLLQAVVRADKLLASTRPQESDVFILAVPTPITEDNRADISYVEKAAISIAPYLKAGNLVVLESTSPVGTTEKVAEILAGLRPDLSFPKHGDSLPADILMAYCPERVLPGNAINELIHNARTIGGMNLESSQRAAEAYRLFCKGTMNFTDARTAEMAKLVENSYRDVNIAFANELSMICEKADINVHELIRFANFHPRVKILSPGVGVGGHCIPVDPWFIVEAFPEDARMIRSAREVNLRKEDFVVEKILQKAAAVNASRVALLGLAYKPNVDDFRESPSIHIAKRFTAKFNGEILIVEPLSQKSPLSLSSQYVSYTTEVQLETLEQFDLVVVLTHHEQFSKVVEQGSIQRKLMTF